MTENGDLGPYRAAFARVAADPHQHPAVAERDGRVVGTLHPGILRGLSRQGSAPTRTASASGSASPGRIADSS